MHVVSAIPCSVCMGSTRVERWSAHQSCIYILHFLPFIHYSACTLYWGPHSWFPQCRHLNVINSKAAQLLWWQREYISAVFVYFFCMPEKVRVGGLCCTSPVEPNKTQQWPQYHPYFKQLLPNRGSLTLGCQLFNFSGLRSKPNHSTAAQVLFF